jgi:hypothetical protein
MPKIYVPGPGGSGPLRWQDDVTGELPKAVLAFWNHFIEKTPITAGQTEMVRDYIEYYIDAPCWATGEGEDSGYYEDFMALKERVRSLKTVEEIDAWLKDAYSLGLDPL